MKLLDTFNFILSHPLNKNHKITAILRFIKWQIRSRISNQPIRHRFTDKSVLIVNKGMSGATGNIYCGLHEFEDMSFLLHFLREKDLFVDIGANVGTYTILASAHIGAHTFTFEPIPSTFKYLKRNIASNNAEDKVNAFNMAVGHQQGVIGFTTSLDAMNHVSANGEEEAIQVSVDTLDNIIGDEQPSLLKVDVEGFETEVLKGAQKILSQKNLKAIIIELNGSGKRYGFNEIEIHNNLAHLGFHPYKYHPFERAITKINSFGSYNTIYVRDVEFVQQRVSTAEKVKIMNHLI